MTTDRDLVVATVLAHNNPWSAARVLGALRAQSRPVDEVVIVDNGSSVPLIDQFKAAEITLRTNEHVLRSDTNRGVGAGHNLGIDYARALGSDLIWILEHDSFADPDCLAVLLGLLGPDDAVIAVPLLARNEYERVLADRRPPGSGAHSTEHGHVLTFNGILLAASLLDRIGPLREDLGVGLEDRDFLRRAVGVGARLAFPSRTLMIHPTRGNNRFPEPVAPERLYYSVRNALVEERERGDKPALLRLARTVGAAGLDVVHRESDAAHHRLRGLWDGLTMPVAPAHISGPGQVQIDVVAAPPPVDSTATHDVTLCRVCGEGSSDTVFQVRSWRLLPQHSSFSYSECSACGSLTLLDDADPSGFYGASYDRLRPRRTLNPDLRHLVAGRVGRALARSRVMASVSLLDRYASSWYAWFRGSRLTGDTPILDVGCGNGAMLDHLRLFGFSNLTGTDPFLVSETSEGSIRLRRAELSDLPARPEFGIILFNHSLEHVDDPLESLRAACSRLLDGGLIVVRVPIVGGAAWRRYRDNFSSLDAPLHRFIPTPNGVQYLARRAGAQVVRWVGESTPWYYLASEIIRRGINPEVVNPREALGQRQQRWAERAARRERGSESGQATFVIRPDRGAT